MALHQSNELPLMEEQGQDIMPATATSFGVEVTEISRLPAPYSSQCISSWEETTIEGETSNARQGEDEKIPDYSMIMCGRVCVLHHIASAYIAL